ncbi:MAG: hypothetical protein NVV59_09640 [Chitinophagaceae bacterium]|nr:hypothetical protein [Chitinophagaceae bacterium]
MERNFSNSDFERYVQKNADQYRMFPSEKVWNNVHKALHKRRRWYGLGLACLLLLTGTAVTLVMRSYPIVKKDGNLTSAQTPAYISNASESDEAIISQPTDIRDLTPFEDIDQEVEEAIRAALAPQPAVLADNRNATNFNNSNSEILKAGGGTISAINSRSQEMLLSNRPQPEVQKPQAIIVKMEDYLRNLKAPEDVAVHEVPAEETKAQDAIVEFNNVPPYTIESVVNSYKPAPKHISWQFFITPTISYRKLSANQDFQASPGGPLPFPFANLDNVNNAVTHKPDLGFQIGMTGRYPLSKRINLRGGVQLNVNKYDIKAFAYPGEVAVINLDDPNSTTVATWTRYRSQSGYKSNWLKNSYISISVPVGAEVKLFGNKHTNVGIAGTIQPTYVVRDKAYLISTDYKNYAQVPWLIRRVNISTGFEAFVNYGKGKTQWQVGPQVRYQMLSSFQNKYPVKENLFDFGLKIGVTLNQ